MVNVIRIPPATLIQHTNKLKIYPIKIPSYKSCSNVILFKLIFFFKHDKYDSLAKFMHLNPNTKFTVLKFLKIWLVLKNNNKKGGVNFKVKFSINI